MSDDLPPDDDLPSMSEGELLGPPDGVEHLDERGHAHMEVDDPYEVPPAELEPTPEPTPEPDPGDSMDLTDGGTVRSVSSTGPTGPTGGARDGSDPHRGGHRSRWGWRSLVRPIDVDRPGTMPAGMILVIVLLAFVVAALVNADATLRKSQARGDGFRQEVAAAVADVSGSLHLTAPRNLLDEAMGRSVGATPGLDELLAEQEVESSPEGSVVDGTTATTGTTVPQPPALRTPTPDDPLKMYIGGDSVLGSMGVQLQPIAASTGLFTPSLDYKVGTGLVRPQFYNWPEHLVKDVIPGEDPDVMVLMFGANDDQNMELDGGTVLTKYTTEWYTEYRKRVGGLMDLLKSPDDDRLIVWVGSSPNGPGSQISNQDVLNYIYWSEARSRPWVSYVDTYAFLGWDSFTFVGNQTNADGVTRNMYQKDNLHLATTGAQRLAWGVMRHLGELIDLSSTQKEPPPSESAPDSVLERETLPTPEADTGA